MDLILYYLTFCTKCCQVGTTLFHRSRWLDNKQVSKDLKPNTVSRLRCVSAILFHHVQKSPMQKTGNTKDGLIQKMGRLSSSSLFSSNSFLRMR